MTMDHSGYGEFKGRGHTDSGRPTEQELRNEGYDRETRTAILRAIEANPAAEEAILEVADLAKTNGAENATNGYGYPVEL